MVFKAIRPPALPYFIYASWYQRADDQWHFGGDNNFKTFDYSHGHEPYAQQSWYTAYGPPHPAAIGHGAAMDLAGRNAAE